MNYEEIKKNPDYNFLNNVKNLCYLSVAGSRAYGTNTPTSDTDIRGFFMNPLEEILSSKPLVEQIENKRTDTVIFSFKKLISLLVNCNPNIIELLGTKEEHHLFVNDVAKHLLENKKMFLSKRAFYSFAGYANAQLRRLENALAREGNTNKHIVKSFETEAEGCVDAFRILNGENDIKFYLSDENEIMVDFSLKNVSLKEFLHVRNNMETMLKNYGKFSGRNKKKDEPHLYKHAMHLVRLYLMAIDILRDGEINTYREAEHDLLMSIRNGEVEFEKIFSYREELEGKLRKVMDESKLPDSVDLEEIDRFVIKEQRQYFNI